MRVLLISIKRDECTDKKRPKKFSFRAEPPGGKKKFFGGDGGSDSAPAAPLL